MTTIVIRKDKNDSYRGFLCMGHAQYAKKHFFRAEPDILCAAISMMVISTINSLEELAGEKLTVTSNEETGFIRCDFEGVLQEKSAFLMDSMVFSLENLSKKYGGQYLQIRFEEV
ncbi:MAG TPA: ribosomal-processing cysteine protease Prp [Candidatus Acetatifactor stercoripullorum]|uniref:Ribosomal processing cysteine protease Prp n=1 Tax=Candidatus Acetatifactor stercoripullorum TaxID=2838414 RepID=A0A9D1UBT9_9FIRM|nr:ribosomal-processing cysteine protease Prp [Candidatus Acetatifactor stercoripullorum]HIW81508.1 ribosomal-processing cysteine protease Prp [Candidatus Acetatifactor stercoripullorum]